MWALKFIRDRAVIAPAKLVLSEWLSYGAGAACLPGFGVFVSHVSQDSDVAVPSPNALNKIVILPRERDNGDGSDLSKSVNDGNTCSTSTESQ